MRVPASGSVPTSSVSASIGSRTCTTSPASNRSSSTPRATSHSRTSPSVPPDASRPGPAKATVRVAPESGTSGSRRPLANSTSRIGPSRVGTAAIVSSQARPVGSPSPVR
ncbi:hypothetical protein BJF79_04485 [Actinomadura sp. CNU-125]|nr:hypothetical protein BJF79_04485 [Actinomadura sp. CNU-125]